MEQYISKSALVTEIERRISEYENCSIDNTAINAKIIALHSLLIYINTLEVKEVGFEDSVKETLAQKYIDYTFKRHNIDPESKEGQLIYYAYIHGMNQCLNELKAQKGEEL